MPIVNQSIGDGLATLRFTQNASLIANTASGGTIEIKTINWSANGASWIIKRGSTVILSLSGSGSMDFDAVGVSIETAAEKSSNLQVVVTDSTSGGSITLRVKKKFTDSTNNQIVELPALADQSGGGASAAIQTLLSTMLSGQWKHVTSNTAAGSGGDPQDVFEAATMANYNANSITGTGNRAYSSDAAVAAGFPGVVGGPSAKFAWSPPMIDSGTGDLVYMCPGGHKDSGQGPVLHFSMEQACANINIGGGDGGIWTRKLKSGSYRPKTDPKPSYSSQQGSAGINTKWIDENADNVEMPISSHNYYGSQFLGANDYSYAGWSAWSDDSGDTNIGGLWIYNVVNNTFTLRHNPGNNTFNSGFSPLDASSGQMPVNMYVPDSDSIYWWGPSFDDVTRVANVVSGVISSEDVLSPTNASASVVGLSPSCLIEHPTTAGEKTWFMLKNINSSLEYVALHGMVANSAGVWNQGTFTNNPVTVVTDGTTNFYAICTGLPGFSSVFMKGNGSTGKIYTANVANTTSVTFNTYQESPTGDIPSSGVSATIQSDNLEYLAKYDCIVYGNWNGVWIYKI